MHVCNKKKAREEAKRDGVQTDSKASAMHVANSDTMRNGVTKQERRRRRQDELDGWRMGPGME